MSQESPPVTIAGRNPVREALKAKRPINKIIVARGGQSGPLQDILGLARERQIPVQQVDRSFLDRLIPDAAHQGVAAVAAPREYVDIEDLLAGISGEDPFLILLDEVTDPHNLGAILRSADAAGVHGVVIPRRRSASLTPVVAKASAGAVEYVSVARVTNMVQTIQLLQKRGIWVVGADPSGESLWESRLGGPVALVIGGEDKGLGRLVKEKCDHLVSIPMLGNVGSLNASVAGALLAYEVVRQRRQLKHGRVSAD